MSRKHTRKTVQDMEQPVVKLDVDYSTVDTEPKLCAAERQAILQRLGAGKWQVFGAHGYKKDYNVNIE